MTQLAPLPHSEETERAVLGAIVLQPEAIATVSGRLAVADFYIDRNQLVYQAMLELQDVGVEIDLRTLQATLERHGFQDRVGGLAYLAGLDLDLPALSRLDRYVEIVKECSLRRQLVDRCHSVAQSCVGGGLKVEDALAALDKATLEIQEQVSARGFQAWDDVVTGTIDLIEDRWAGDSQGLSTGIADWDRLTQGLWPGQLVVVAARPGMGKTSFALNVAQHCAFQLRRPAGFFSLEMSAQELGMRVLASESGIPFEHLRAGSLDVRSFTSLLETARRLQGAALAIDDHSATNLVELCSKARSLRRRTDLALLVVDYIQLLDAGGRYDNRVQEVAAITRHLKKLAQELEIPILALSQLSRQPEYRGDHRPVLSDLRDSGTIEQDADMVCFLYRDEVYYPDDSDNKGLAELIVAKQRNGPTGTLELAFLGEIMSFRSLASPPQPSNEAGSEILRAAS